MKSLGNTLTLVTILLSFVVIPPIVAQTWPVPKEHDRSALLPEPEWGTSAESALTIGSLEFQGYRAGTTLDVANGFADRFVSAAVAGSQVAATFHLPKGALITGFDFLGCNTSTSNFSYVLYQMHPGGGVAWGSGVVNANVGCGAFRTNVSATVDATTGPYMVLWAPNALNNTQLLTAMRIYYKLQVSPSPSVATFNDVPLTHPFNKFVEALYASGITAGCGGGNYCPDAPVTRGQMAVFLAAALGLHWAP